jgi:hypothetical protein
MEKRTSGESLNSSLYTQTCTGRVLINTTPAEVLTFGKNACPKCVTHIQLQHDHIGLLNCYVGIFSCLLIFGVKHRFLKDI